MNKKVQQFLVEHREELLIFTYVLVAVIGILKASSVFLVGYEEKAEAVNETFSTNAYRLFVNDQDVGLVPTTDEGEDILKDAIQKVAEELGYDPEVHPKVRFYEEYARNQEFDLKEDNIDSTKDIIIASIDTIKVKAYAMKIGDDFVISLKSKEEVEEVLENVQKLYVSSDTDIDIELESDPHNGLIEKPKVLIKQEDITEGRNLVTSGVSRSASADAKELKEEDVYIEEDAVMDPEYNGKTVEIDFTQEVMVVETFVEEDKISSIDEATDLITKENQEPKKYTVKSGDCPSTIAHDNEMSLKQLYSLNSGLEASKNIQVGDELIVMVPEPELSVTTTEEVVYETEIQRETSYKDNPNKYVGSNKVLDNGEDGVMKVTARLTKVNGDEVNRLITKEEVAQAPKDKVVERGTKPLPAKAATGKYIPPLASYYLSSGYGARWGSFHYGVDMAAPTGTVIRASDGGTVVYSGWMNSYGYIVILDHGKGVTTRYAHCSKLSVKVGQRVAQYQQIAKVGSTGRSTGPHVHFEIRFDDVAVNPMKYLSYK